MSRGSPCQPTDVARHYTPGHGPTVRRSCCSPSSGSGVFLAGLELMVTAVALPSILVDLADPRTGTAWVELRKASLDHQRLPAGLHPDDAAGRPAGRPVGRAAAVHGRRSAIFVVGSALAGAAQTLDQLIAARLVQAVGGGVLVPVGDGRRRRTCSTARRGRGRSGSIGALTFLGMAAGPVRRRRDPRLGPRRDALAVGAARRPLRPRPRPGLALGLLPQRPDRARRAAPRPGRPRAGWETPRRAGPRRRRSVRRWFGLALRRRAGRADPRRDRRDRRQRPSTRRS